MKDYFHTSRKKAFILMYVTFLAFLLISLLSYVQIYLNSRFKIYNLGKIEFKNYSDVDFLDEIMNLEFKNIENYINSGNISNVLEYFEKNSKDNFIYLEDDFSNRTSMGGYNLAGDHKNYDIKRELKNALNKSFRFVRFSYRKFIFFDNKKFLLEATITYDVDSTKSLLNLKNPNLERMSIKEEV